MRLSDFGEKFATDSGIVGLMYDLGNALLENPDMVMMGGGNPGRLPAMEAVFRQRLEAALRDPDESHRLLGRYQSPQGDREFRAAVADFLRGQFGWPGGGISRVNRPTRPSVRTRTRLVRHYVAVPDSPHRREPDHRPSDAHTDRGARRRSNVGADPVAR